MKIKAIIMDGDGSTLTHDGKLPENLKQLIQNNSQLKWIMATGRSLDLLKRTPIAEHLSKDTFHICDGGSCLIYLDGTIKTKHAIEPHELELLFTKIDLDKTSFIYFSPDGIHGYAYSIDIFLRQRFSSLGLTNIVLTESITEFKKLAFELQPSKILLNITEEFNLSGIHYHRNENNIDITKEGINKGSACIELLTELNLHPHECVFVFNDKNDLPLVEHPNLQEITTIKVGNFLPDTQSDYHVSTPHDVAAIIQKLI